MFSFSRCLGSIIRGTKGSRAGQSVSCRDAVESCPALLFVDTEVVSAAERTRGERVDRSATTCDSGSSPHDGGRVSERMSFSMIDREGSLRARCFTAGTRLIRRMPSESVWYCFICLPYVRPQAHCGTPSVGRRRCHDSMTDGKKTTAWALVKLCLFSPRRGRLEICVEIVR